jgi:hypothetical protein
MISLRIRKRSTVTAGIIALGISLMSAPAWAGFYTSSFKITQYYVAAPGNYQYRISGLPVTSSCPSSGDWAYLEDTDPGSKAYISAILSAFYAGNSVSLYVTPVNGYCHIGEVVVHQ